MVKYLLINEQEWNSLWKSTGKAIKINDKQLGTIQKKRKNGQPSKIRYEKPTIHML